MMIHFNKITFPDLLFKIIAHQSCEATSKYYCYKQNVNPWIAVIIEIKRSIFCLDTQILYLTWNIWVHFPQSLIRSGLHFILNVVHVMSPLLRANIDNLLMLLFTSFPLALGWTTSTISCYIHFLLSSF